MDIVMMMQWQYIVLPQANTKNQQWLFKSSYTQSGLASHSISIKHECQLVSISFSILANIISALACSLSQDTICAII